MPTLRQQFLAENGVYHAAKNRCNNPNVKNYHRYGGRGIEFRFSSFKEFIEHIGPRPSSNHQLDRIETNGHYEIGNVRWATCEDNNNNTRRNHLLTHDGKTQSVSRWAREYGIPEETFRSRIKRGWSWELATYKANAADSTGVTGR